MRARTTLLLLLAVIGLGLYLHFFERRADSTRERVRRRLQAFRVSPAEVSLVRIQTEKLTFECEKDGDEWVLRDPAGARADAGAVEAILYRIEELERSEIITSEERAERNLSLADYGMTEPRARIIVGDRDAHRTLLVGRDAPLGGHLYVKEETSEDILAVDRVFFDSLPAELSDVRERLLITTPRTKVQRIGIRRADGFIHLVRDEAGQWMIQQPVATRADAAKVERLIDEILLTRIEVFVADGVADFTTYGLTEPDVQLTWWTSADEGGRTLFIGSAVPERDGMVYARWQDSSSVYALSRRVPERLAFKLNDLRDRRLVSLAASEINGIRMEEGDLLLDLRKESDSRWRVVAPRPGPADLHRVMALIEAWAGAQASAFIDDAATNLAAYGLAPPARVITFWALPPGQGTNAVPDGRSVRIGISSMESPDRRLLVKIEQESTLYEIDRSVADALSLDPLHFRDREVLRIERDRVQKITQTAGGRETVIERDPATGVLVAPSGGTNVLDTGAVHELLLAAQSLMASGFVREDPGQLDRYGLDAPRAAITFWMGGDAGIGKSILLGRETNEGVYAMIRGQDLVFMVEKAVADRLTGVLLRPPSALQEMPADAGNP